MVEKANVAMANERKMFPPGRKLNAIFVNRPEFSNVLLSKAWASGEYCPAYSYPALLMVLIRPVTTTSPVRVQITNVSQNAPEERMRA